MAGEITAGSEEMAAAANQVAHTAGDLSHQSSSMAEAVQGLAAASEGNSIQSASALDAGAADGVRRNAHLRALSAQNRTRLDESSSALELLSTEAELGRTTIEGLAAASEDVRSFVTLVKRLARQSKLLALNAAMEAARAGDQGHGFSVVAEEVRRLAVMSSDAAEQIDRVLSAVLRRNRPLTRRQRANGHHRTRCAERDGRRLAVVWGDRTGRRGHRSLDRVDSPHGDGGNAIGARSPQSGSRRLASGTDSFACRDAGSGGVERGAAECQQ